MQIINYSEKEVRLRPEAGYVIIEKKNPSRKYSEVICAKNLVSFYDEEALATEALQEEVVVAKRSRKKSGGGE